MLLLTYTTYDQIRSILGVSVEEIEDIDLGQQILADTVEERILDMSATVLTRYDEITVLSQSAAATAEQLKLQKRLNMYVAYLAAREILGSAEMYFPQAIEDGRAKMTRFAMSPAYGDNIRAMCSDLRAKIVAQINNIYPGEAVVVDNRISLMSVVGLATDPVIQ